MEKKVRYLMLLLCLFMFPFRVYALEDTLEEYSDEQSNVVVANEQSNEEYDLEDLVAITDPEAVLEETEIEDAEIVSMTEEGEIVQEEAAIIEEGYEAYTEITVLDLNFPEELSLQVGGAFPYAVTEGYTGYKVVSQDWYDVYEYSIAGSIEAGNLYRYVFAIEVEDGAVLNLVDGGITLNINGEPLYYAYNYTPENAEPNVYYFDPVCYLFPTVYVEVEDVIIENLVRDVIVGQAPLYGASIDDIHFFLVDEFWIYKNCEEGVCTSLRNTKDTWDEDDFAIFEEGKDYYHGMEIYTYAGYRLNVQDGEVVNIDGIDYQVEVLADSNSFMQYIFTTVDPVEITEVTEFEVTENPDSTVYTDSLEDVTVGISEEDFGTFINVYIDGELVEKEDIYSGNVNYIVEEGKAFITFTKEFLSSLAKGIHNIAIRFSKGMAYTTIEITEKEATTTTNTSTSNEAVNCVATYETYEKETEETKLEVKEKEEEKEKIDEEDEEKESNIGLIIFLIILIIIAIAIPVTIYRKKQ